MQTTYSQKTDVAQRASDSSAESLVDLSSQGESLQRKADLTNNAAQRAEAPRPNNTGMPDNLKSGIESLSGFSMDDVRVHYNSSKPATVQALAYTQGTDIHVAPGQEKHLPHEAWHVAQQMAGRVSPTTNINGMPVNDNAALEHEADVMGAKAVQCVRDDACRELVNKNLSQGAVQCEFVSRIKAFPEVIIDRDETRDDRGVAGTGRGVTRAGRGVAETGRGVTRAGRGVAGTGRGVTRAGRGVTETGRAVTRDDSDKSVDLPVIAFEVMVGVGGRIGEIATLYNNVIGKYNGPAHIYVGVNQMSYEHPGYFDKDGVKDGKKHKKGDPQSQPSEEDAKKLVDVDDLPSDLNDAVAQIQKIQVNFNHLMHIIPFVFIPTYNRKEDEMGGYAFPFMEARHLLMSKARECGASVFRWIDSDVEDDTSIAEVNEKGDGAFGYNLYEGAPPVVFSGFYNWRGGNAGDNVDKINTHEAFLRKFFWYSQGCYDGYNPKEYKYDEKYGYIPEPIAYMNEAAHQKAMDQLQKKFEALGYKGVDSCQQNESRTAFDELSMIFKPTFSVSKPVKEDYHVSISEETLEKLSDVRQSAFGHWKLQTNPVQDDSKKKYALALSIGLNALLSQNKVSISKENEEGLLLKIFNAIIEGKEKNVTRALAKKLKSMEMPVDKISEITGLSVDGD